MEYVATGGHRSAHPFGISRVDITSAGGTVVHLDRFAGVIENRVYPMADHVVCQLLPYARPGIQVDGASGLRAQAVDDRDLHLTRVGGTSSVVLRGTQEFRWPQELVERQSRLEDDRCPPLWRKLRISDHERDDESRYPGITKERRDLVWLGSGLLRRIGLFHTVSSAHSIDSWISDGDWKFELTTRHDVPLDHGRFLGRLMDDRYGLPVRVSHSYCSCDVSLPLDSRRYGRTCIYYLVHNGRDEKKLGRLQLRFRHEPGSRIDVRESLEIAGADPRWLDRVTPKRPVIDSRGRQHS